MEDKDVLSSVKDRSAIPTRMLALTDAGSVTIDMELDETSELGESDSGPVVEAGDENDGNDESEEEKMETDEPQPKHQPEIHFQPIQKKKSGREVSRLSNEDVMKEVETFGNMQSNRAIKQAQKKNKRSAKRAVKDMLKESMEQE